MKRKTPLTASVGARGETEPSGTFTIKTKYEMLVTNRGRGGREGREGRGGRGGREGRGGRGGRRGQRRNEEEKAWLGELGR